MCLLQGQVLQGQVLHPNSIDHCSFQQHQVAKNVIPSYLASNLYVKEVACDCADAASLVQSLASWAVTFGSRACEEHWCCCWHGAGGCPGCHGHSTPAPSTSCHYPVHSKKIIRPSIASIWSHCVHNETNRSNRVVPCAKNTNNSCCHVKRGTNILSIFQCLMTIATR